MQSNLDKILASASFRRAYEDIDFLKEEDLRPVRLQLELLKPERIMNRESIHSTIVVFGSARIPTPETSQAALDAAQANATAHPDDREAQQQLARARVAYENSKYYREAEEFSRIVSTTCQINGNCDFVVVTGGGPGIMEAANKGAYDVNAKSVGLAITLPREQAPNEFITPELCFRFHYFALRKMHFLLRAKAMVAFPGGFGTLDEVFETLTLIQTQKKSLIPVMMFGESYWRKLINFDFLAEQGMITYDDLKLFRFVESAQEAWDHITDFYQERGQWPFNGKK